MGLLDRYRLAVKRPAPKSFEAVAQNIRQIERWANVLPVPELRSIGRSGGFVPFALSQVDSYNLALGYPNTVLGIDLSVRCTATIAGGGVALFRAYIDGVDVDNGEVAVMHENAEQVTISAHYVTTVVKPGTHTLELWANKTINAGTFTYDAGFRVWVF